MDENKIVENQEIFVEPESEYKNKYQGKKFKNKKKFENIENKEEIDVVDDIAVANEEPRVEVQIPIDENIIEKVEKVVKKKGKVIMKGKVTISIATEDQGNITLFGYRDAQIGDIVEY